MTGGRGGEGPPRPPVASGLQAQHPERLVGDHGGEHAREQCRAEQRRAVATQTPQKQGTRRDDADLEGDRRDRPGAEEVVHHVVRLGGEAQPQRVPGEQKIGDVQHPQTDQQPEEDAASRRDPGAASGACSRRSSGELRGLDPGGAAVPFVDQPRNGAAADQGGPHPAVHAGDLEGGAVAEVAAHHAVGGVGRLLGPHHGVSVDGGRRGCPNAIGDDARDAGVHVLRHDAPRARQCVLPPPDERAPREIETGEVGGSTEPAGDDRPGAAVRSRRRARRRWGHLRPPAPRPRARRR